MDISSAESRDRLRQALDVEINTWKESTRALRSRRNALAPISRLPPETLAVIFSFLSPSAWDKEAGHFARMCVAHVCHRWRETALNHPRLWSHIDFTKLTPAAMAKILARAKMMPLHLEADVIKLSVAQYEAFGSQLEEHISHTRYLSISGCLQTTLDRLVSSAPTLEFLSLSHKSRKSAMPQVAITVNLFNCTAPRLTSLELENCGISWKSPLLRGLRTLKIHNLSTASRPELEDLLDALNDMPQLETLILQSATPQAPQALKLISPSRPATFPSLVRFHISASARDCALALAHLTLPALTWLHVDAESYDSEGGDAHFLIPYVARKVHVLQDIKLLRSVLISGERTRVEVLAWSISDADFKDRDPNLLFRASVPVRWVFTDPVHIDLVYGVDTAIFDALLTHLPLNSISTLTAQTTDIRLTKEFWLSHASRWPLLERARLVPTTFRAFREMLAEDAPPDGPRLSSLTELILVEVTLTELRTSCLRDMLIKRVEQGVPLEVLDLRQCVVACRVIRWLTEIVVDVEEPPSKSREPPIMYYDDVDYYESGPWYENRRGFWFDDADEYDEAEYGDDDGYDDYGFYCGTTVL